MGRAKIVPGLDGGGGGGGVCTEYSPDRNTELLGAYSFLPPFFLSPPLVKKNPCGAKPTDFIGNTQGRRF